MSKQPELESLEKALSFSPDNIELNLLLTQKYLECNMIDKVEEMANKILSLDSTNPKGKEYLSEAFYRKGKLSAIIIIAEESGDPIQLSERMKILYAKALLQEGNKKMAQEIYHMVIEKNKDFQDNELDEQLRISTYDILDEIEQSDSVFLEKPDINFSHVGGLDKIKKEINLKIIKPLENPDLFKAYGKKIGGGILLYGPPGVGKTYIAKATAGEINAKFINVTISDILDMWIGKSEQNLAEIFAIARKNTPCVMFFDEVDALGANRASFATSSGKNIINQFLAELDGIQSKNDGLLIIGATNMPWSIDSAFRRPGRFDRIIFVPPPDQDARTHIFELQLKDRPTANIDYKKLAKQTDQYSGADIQAIIDIAIEAKLEKAMETGNIEPLNTSDLLQAIKVHKPTTLDWFNTAKNYALYANQGGLYDDVLKYIK